MNCLTNSKIITQIRRARISNNHVTSSCLQIIQHAQDTMYVNGPASVRSLKDDAHRRVQKCSSDTGNLSLKLRIIVMVHAFVVPFAVSLVAVTPGLEALLNFVVCLSIRPVPSHCWSGTAAVNWDLHDRGFTVK